jgi:hypothetical protein
MRSIPGRLDILASCRNRPGLLRYGLLYRLVCLILGNTLRFLFRCRAPVIVFVAGGPVETVVVDRFFHL